MCCLFPLEILFVLFVYVYVQDSLIACGWVLTKVGVILPTWLCHLVKLLSRLKFLKACLMFQGFATPHILLYRPQLTALLVSSATKHLP